MLNEKVKNLVDRWEKPHHTFSDKVFGERDRITIPLAHRLNFPPEEKVKDFLEARGFRITDYMEGFVERDGRTYRLGKILDRYEAPTDIRRAFDHDPRRQAVNNIANMVVTISRNPYDVAGMSTGHSWTSCLDLEHPSQNLPYYLIEETLKNEVKHGTHIAFMHNKNDTECNHPIARIALRPHFSDKGDVILAYCEMYGNGGPTFARTVEEWTETNFPSLNGHTYTIHPKVYHINRDEKDMYDAAASDHISDLQKT